jgi:hypothetical protein
MLLTFKRPEPAFIEVEELMQMVQPRSLLDERLYRIVCIGNDPQLLCSRCAVLASERYHAQWTSPFKARQTLNDSGFDLVVLCSTLTKQETEWVRACIPHGPKILAITHMILPDTLLCIVRHLLRCSDSGQSIGLLARPIYSVW